MALQRADADLQKCDHVNFFLLGGGGGGGVGGVVRLTAKPRYLLLLHRGKEKSNTVTALVEIPLDNVERFECLEKTPINLMIYYYLGGKNKSIV